MRRLSDRSPILRWWFVGLFLVAANCAPAQVPADIANSAARREERLAHNTYDYDMVEIMDHAGTSEADRDERSRKFVSDGSKMLVTGERDGGAPAHVLLKYEQYYDGSIGMISNTASQAGDSRGRPIPPKIFQSPGDSTRYLCPFADNLSIRPEDFVLLTGRNPLALYGTPWKLEETTPTTWVVTAHVAHDSNKHPFNVRMVLSRAHDGTVMEIVETSEVIIELKTTARTKVPLWTVHYTVSQFQQQAGEWLPSEISFTSSWPELIEWKRSWRLQNVSASSMHEYKLPKETTFVSDYRLLGKNLTLHEALMAGKPTHNDIVSYLWTGKLPSEADLHKLNERVNGPRRPAPSWLAVVPGLLLIALGWYYYRRVEKRKNTRGHAGNPPKA